MPSNFDWLDYHLWMFWMSRWRLMISGGIALFALLSALQPTMAQIVPDGSSNTQIDGCDRRCTINGGDRQGRSQLMHRFREFNVRDGQRVRFATPDGINAIIAEVTGRSPSAILGELGVEGSADLILINPNGILFGPNARLDIRGSFTAATATRYGLLEFGNETALIAYEQPAPLLTVSVAAGLQQGASLRGRIVNQGLLRVGENLSLVARDLDLEGGFIAGSYLEFDAQDALRIGDRADRPFLAIAPLAIIRGKTADISYRNSLSGFYTEGVGLGWDSDSTFLDIATDARFRYSSLTVDLDQPNLLLGGRDASQELVQTCPTADDATAARGTFVVTGRGGIPADPGDILGGEVVLSQLASLEGVVDHTSEPVQQSNSKPPAAQSPPSDSPPLLEAQGWQINAQGQVILVAERSSGELHQSALPRAAVCPGNS